MRSEADEWLSWCAVWRRVEK